MNTLCVVPKLFFCLGSMSAKQDYVNQFHLILVIDRKYNTLKVEEIEKMNDIV